MTRQHRPIVRPVTARALDILRLLTPLLLAVGLAGAQLKAANATNPPTGLVGTFRSTTTPGSGNATADTEITPAVSLYVPAGSSSTPFLPAGPFTTTWEGQLTVESEGSYRFRAELNGAVTLELNGAPALRASGSGDATEPGEPIILRRGTNSFRLQFTSPAAGHAFVRLQWQPKDSFFQPLPPTALSHDAEPPALVSARQLRLGRELFVEYRCAKCHFAPPGNPGTGMPELAMDAPALKGIASRRNPAWLAEWIANPAALRPSARMPKLLHGPASAENSAAITAFLASLPSSPQPTLPPATPALVSAGKRLFAALHCEACHDGPEAKTNSPARISLASVGQKFAPGALGTFLLQPQAHYAWIRMPNFQLTPAEASQLGAYLTATVAPTPTTPAAPPAEATSVERGRRLVQTSGCLNCHVLELPNQSKAPRLNDLVGGAWQRGCLAPTADAAGTAPQFTFTPEQRAALAAFGATDHTSLERHVPAEFAVRQTRNLNCRECHGRFEGFPALDGLGAKLQPEWVAHFISGEITNKPRPWITARMPAFPHGQALAEGLAQGSGYPAHTPPDPSIDITQVPIGQKLISMAGGFACVSCHAVGSVQAAQTSETAGINLALTGSRVRKSFFLRWVRNPQLVDPGTKMPVYFDEEGRSPLPDVLGGDATKQLLAIWEYLRLGDQMPPPLTP